MAALASVVPGEGMVKAARMPPSAQTPAAMRAALRNPAENRAGLIRFIRMVSQRPPGMPCS